MSWTLLFKPNEWKKGKAGEPRSWAPKIAGERSQAHTAEFFSANAGWNSYHCSLLAPSAYSRAPVFSEFLGPKIYTLTTGTPLTRNDCRVLLRRPTWLESATVCRHLKQSEQQDSKKQKLTPIPPSTPARRYFSFCVSRWYLSTSFPRSTDCRRRKIWKWRRRDATIDRRRLRCSVWTGHRFRPLFWPLVNLLSVLFIRPRFHDAACCQPRPVVSYKQTSNLLSHPLYDRFDNRLYRVNGWLKHGERGGTLFLGP